MSRRPAYLVATSSAVGVMIVLFGIATNLGTWMTSDGEFLGPRATLAGTGFLIFLLLVLSLRRLGRRRRGVVSLNAWAASGVWPLGLLALQLGALIRTAITEDRLALEGTYYALLLAMQLAFYLVSSRYLYGLGRGADYWKYLALGVGALCALSLLLRLFGVSGPAPEGIEPSVTLGLLGITATRPSMPFFSGYNSAGILFGLATVLSCLSAVLVRLTAARAFWLLVGFAFLLALCWLDTRGAILAAVITVVVGALGRRGVVGALAILVAAVAVLIVSDVTIDLSAYSRAGTDITSSRDFLFRAALAHLAVPSIDHVLGYGAWGQYVSGLSQSFHGIFTEDVYDIASLHNAIIQVVFDTGYVGLVFYLVTWMSILKSTWDLHTQRRELETAVKLGLAVYFLVDGLFEAVVGYSNSASFFVYVGVLAGFVTDQSHRRTVRDA